MSTLAKALVSSPQVSRDFNLYLLEAYTPLFISVTGGGSSVGDSDARRAVVAYAILEHSLMAFEASLKYLSRSRMVWSAGRAGP